MGGWGLTNFSDHILGLHQRSLPPTSLSTSSSNLKLFLITRGRRRRATFEASSSHFLSSILGPCGAHQVNARAVVERGHPSRKVHERLKLGGCETFFYSCFANISAPKWKSIKMALISPSLLASFDFICSSILVIWPNQSHIKEVAAIWKHLYGNGSRYFQQLADWAS